MTSIVSYLFSDDIVNSLAIILFSEDIFNDHITDILEIPKSKHKTSTLKLKEKINNNKEINNKDPFERYVDKLLKD